MTDLEKQAEELGITVDKDWSDDQLQAEIDKVLSAPSKPKAKVAKTEPKPKQEAKTPVKLLYDRWDTDAERVKAGTVVSLPLSEAKKLIASGKAERADPLPGDE